MLLAINAGNSTTVVAVYQDDTLLLKRRVKTEPRRTADEYIALLHVLLQLGGLHRSELSGLVVCGVVPSVVDALEDVGREFLKLEPIVISHNLSLGLDLSYSHPERLGADRIANAVAAVDRFGFPTIVVDLGTATTVDAISVDGAFVGGAIAPGLAVSQQALIERTSQLPFFPLQAPVAYIGSDTITSLQSGLIYGHAGLVDGLVEGLRREVGAHAKVLGTGGLADLVAPHTRTLKHTDPDLTLEGLRLLYYRNL